MNPIKHKGWIALDIDGTITTELLTIPEPVIKYFVHLYQEGWQFIFITGRTFSLSSRPLKALPFPYLLSVQNGADTLRMPEKELFCRRYLTHEVLNTVENAYEGISEDFLVYSGFEKGDFCYFRPEKFSTRLREYLEILKAFAPSPWLEVNAWEENVKEGFPLIKCLGNKIEMEKVCNRLSDNPHLHVTMIRDAVCKDLYLNLITHKQANKGEGLSFALEKIQKKGPLIVAGDDSNDISMFKKADIKVVMETAPPEVLAYADIIAPSAARCGIIEGLQQALESIDRNIWE